MDMPPYLHVNQKSDDDDLIYSNCMENRNTELLSYSIFLGERFKYARVQFCHDNFFLHDMR